MTRLALPLLLLFPSFVWADEAADRAAIARAIADTPSVKISREPWGEATIDLQPKIVNRSIRFITPEVAVVDAETPTTALFFVMKKEGDSWKIATVRVLAQ